MTIKLNYFVRNKKYKYQGKQCQTCAGRFIFCINLRKTNKN